MGNLKEYVIPIAALFLVGVAARDPAQTPKNYEPLNTANIQQKNGKYVQMQGIPSSFYYNNTLYGPRLKIKFQESDIIAETKSFEKPYYLRMINDPSKEKQQAAYEALANLRKKTTENSITLKGKLEGKILEMYAIVVDGVEYSLLKDTGLLTNIQSAIKSF